MQILITSKISYVSLFKNSKKHWFKSLIEKQPVVFSIAIVLVFLKVVLINGL